MSDRVVFGILGAVLIGLGVTFFIYEGLTIRRHYRAPEWPVTSGTITYSSFEKSSWLVGLYSESSARVEYDYSVDGTKYANNVISFLADDVTDTANESHALGQAMAYSAFRRVTVHYDPAAPGTSCLITSGPLRLGSTILTFVVGLLFLALGLLCAIFGVKKKESAEAAPAI
ncbi:hypothetical protein AKJ09_02515 [Labilithrix luteola]|uniref:DUF3592 domain-containing protein n=1 Tax=Labilithrix luteola TaxID=1391654 RepID=A0A0K1PR48_9BACT|nr:DUF3592 domain-containing protein [Labilithrix luteola]AKU95851.1 hypothetical protein AKJ09_02515 [Labilithrix luteola]